MIVDQEFEGSAMAASGSERNLVREPMRNVDKAWLDMDTPVNLMIINGVMLFDGAIDYEQLCTLVRERLVERYVRFRQRIVRTSTTGGLAWEEDPHFDLRCHMRHVALPAPGDERTLQNFMSDLISEALEPNRPLWRFYLIENYEGGCAVFGRLHHAIADGIALVQVLLSLMDENSAGVAPVVEPSVSKRAQSRGMAGLPLTLVGGLLSRTRALVGGLAHLSLHESVQTVTNPQRLIDAAYAAGLISVTSAAILAKLLLIPPDTDSVFKGALGAHKRVAWSESVPLDLVKRIGKQAGATVNDVLVAAVAGALRRYMVEHGGAVDVRAMVPVNLRDMEKPLKSLGNQFALVYLTLPLEAEAPLDRLHDVKRQMDVLKQSPEPLIVFELLNIIGMFPGELADRLTTWFSSKASAVLTNVPGPRTPIHLCGQTLHKLMFWVPQSGRIGLGISIISYQGKVTLGVMVDEGLVDEPEHILDAFQEEFAVLSREIEGTRAAANPPMTNARVPSAHASNGAVASSAPKVEPA